VEDDVNTMSVAPQQMDSARLERALDRLAAHCDLAARRSAAIADRRLTVRARLERELGPELTRVLLTGLS
jgi:hypothetical protein